MKAIWGNLHCEDSYNEDGKYVLQDRRAEGALFFVYNTKKEQVGKFFLVPLPGCPGVLVSTGSEYDGPHGHDFHGLKELTAKLLGASAMIATVDVTNIREVLSIAKAGWNMRDVFHNLHGTGHQVAFWIKVINKLGTEKEEVIPN